MENLEIDLVYLWVDGSDPVWMEKRNAAIGKPNESGTNCKGRYSNHDELKYSIRSIEKYAPWIRKIFIVTDSQTPSWLDTTNPKVRIVDHKEILPPRALPCFNSRVLEHHLHLIPCLAERFIYANDDMLLWKPVTPSDFFAEDGLPIIRFNRRPLRKLSLFIKEKLLHKKLSNYVKTIHRTALLVQKKFGKYYNGKTHHNIDAYLKADNEHIRSIFATEIDASLPNHKRADNDVQRNVYSYAALSLGRAHLKYVTQRTSFRFHIDNPAQYDKLLKYDPTFVCMNDSEFATDADREKAALFLQSRFPEKSSLEK